MTNKDQTNSTPVKRGEQTLTEKPERAGDQDPAALVHSLQVAITQINHNYEVGDELIPTQLLLPMEQARPGTVAEYAQRLLDEPVHRHKLDMHSVAQTYIALSAICQLSIHAPILMAAKIIHQSIRSLPDAG